MSAPNVPQNKTFNSAGFNSPGAATRVLFGQLPRETQEKIVRLQSFKGDHFSQKSSSTYLQYLFIIIGLVWFATLFVWANDALWSTTYIIILGGLTGIAAAVFVYGLYLVIRTQTSRLQPFVHMTPTHFIKTSYNSVEFRDLGQLRGITSDEVLTGGGKHSYSIFDFYFDDREEKVKVYDEQKAKEWFAKLHEFESRYKLAIEQADHDYLQQENIFSSKTGGDVKNLGKSSGAVWALPSLLFLLGVPALTAGAMWGAIGYNQNVSDNESWTEAQKTETAEAFRNYLAAQPNGRHRGEAEQKIEEQYDKAARKYVDRQKGAQNTAAAQTIVRLLEYAKINRQPKVQVIFERHNELTDEVVARIKKERDDSDLVSIGNDFSEEKMKEREKSIVTAIELAFKQVVPSDLLSFVQTESRDEQLPALTIAYNIIPNDTIYHKASGRYYASDQSFVGFTINWDCQLSGPKPIESYSFALNSNPALFLDTQVYEHADQDLTKYSTYEVLTGSAFSDFGKSLANEFGLGEEAIKNTETNKTPIKNPAKKR